MSKHTAITQNQSHFANAVHANIGRSVFMRNSTRKTTFNCGELVPIYCDEVLPGDTFDMDLSFVSRLSTLIFPTMDNLHLDFYALFVPNRLVWDNWEALMGENKTGAWTPSTPPALVPMFGVTVSTVLEKGSIGDYYGLPLGVDFLNAGGVSSLPFRGYGLIWNEWFRDQNLQAPITIHTANSNNQNSLYRPNRPLLKVNKKHDLFTSCLPAPQKGESALIPIELNELIPVITGQDHSVNINRQPLIWRNINGIIPPAGTLSVGGNQAWTYTTSGSSDQTSTVTPANLWGDGRGMQINTTTISELRTAFQIQKLYERDARGGTRYVEMLKAHFGVDAQDYRLQRPEFLGHFHSFVGIQQVPQTSSTDSTSPQGNLAAFSYTAGQKRFFKKSFVEHGFLHIFVVARQSKTYQQGIEKMWSRRDRLDFYLPVLSHISEQPIYVKELYASNNATANDEVFGYNEAWSQYRYKPNSVTGQFRYNVPNSLKEWHYADWYDSRPYLSADWIKDNSMENVDRTLAIPAAMHDQIIMDIAFRCKATRAIPVHSIPGFVDHF